MNLPAFKSITSSIMVTVQKIPTVSIVVPAYNEQEKLRTCLDAIARQTVRPLEVIVVDNNSTDATARIAKSYPFVRLVCEKRQGRVFARNCGFEAARGDVLGRIDADTVLPPAWVEHVQAFYSDSANRQIAWGGAADFKNIRMRALTNFGYDLLAYRFGKLLAGHYTLWGSNMAITRKQWRAVRSSVCLRNDIHEDLDVAVHLAQAGFYIKYDNNMKVSGEMKRVQSGRRELWEYLQWWPRTLRVHGNVLWPVCWFVGAFMLYAASFVWLSVDKLAGYLGYRSAQAPAKTVLSQD